MDNCEKKKNHNKLAVHWKSPLTTLIDGKEYTLELFFQGWGTLGDKSLQQVSVTNGHVYY